MNFHLIISYYKSGSFLNYEVFKKLEWILLYIIACAITEIHTRGAEPAQIPENEGLFDTLYQGREMEIESKVSNF